MSPGERPGPRGRKEAGTWPLFRAGGGAGKWQSFGLKLRLLIPKSGVFSRNRLLQQKPYFYEGFKTKALGEKIR